MHNENKEALAHSELLELQQLVCADIAFFKNQQWQATYYGSLLYLAVVFVPQAVGSTFPTDGYFALALACLLILCGGIYVLSELEDALTHRREILPKVREHFTDKALLAYGVGDKNRALKPADEKTSLAGIFISAYLLGFAASLWILAMKWCAHT